MATEFDAAVVGAGPAGVATALYAHRHGLSVILLDKSLFPRDKVCGDAVARKSLGYLRDLGILDDVRMEAHEPISNAVLAAPNGRSIRLDLKGNSPHAPHMICRRRIFDDALVRAARLRVDVREGATVTGVLRGNRGDVCGVRYTSAGNTEHELTARVVVGADGFNSVVARSLGHYRHDTKRWWVATRQYFRGLAVDPETVEVHYVDDTLPGFLWMFPTGDGAVNVGVGLVHRDAKQRGGIRAVHERVLESPRFRERFRTAAPLEDVRGWNLPTPDSRRVLHGDGFLLAGDAAGLVDPFSGEGIGNAMCSGEVAARVIARACVSRRASGSNDTLDATALAEYPRLLLDELDRRELSIHYRLRSLARRRWLLNFLIGRAASHRGVLNWLSSMTDEHGTLNRKRALTSPLTYLRLIFKGK